MEMIRHSSSILSFWWRFSISTLGLAHLGIRYLCAGWLVKHPLNKQLQCLHWDMVLDL